MNTQKISFPVNYTQLSANMRRRVREEYVRLQDGKCAYCGALLEGPPRSDILKKKIIREHFPSTFFTYPIHLHHDHITGLTKGVVHCYCNAVAWEYDGE